MHVRYQIIIFLLAVAGFSFALPGDPIPSVRKRLESYYRNYPCEKVYLQPDRQVYAAGETIWFSANITYQARPSSISAVLYAELFNDKGFVIQRSVLPVTAGVAAGDLLLPDTLRPGIYCIRAYTAWMLNFSSSLFCYRKIKVEGSKKNTKENKPPAKPDFSVQFFPESGHLVSRLTSQVAFTAVDAAGNAVAVSGKVFNSLGDTVALMNTLHEGLGQFVIHCSPQTTYTALVTAHGITKKIPLPAVENSGVVLHLACNRGNTSDSVFFHISRSGENKEKYENLILCARQENHFSVTKIHFDPSAVNDPMDTMLTAPYPLLLNNFGPGILQVAVITAAGNVLAERLVFLRDYPELTEQMQVATINDSLPGQSSFLLTVPAQYSGRFTVAVTDADRDIESGEHIRSGLLLQSVLDRLVESPGWYLEGTDAVRYRAVDLLMMTNTTAGFDLGKLLAGEMPSLRYQPEKILSVKGRAWEISDGKKSPLINGSLFLLVKTVRDSLSRALSVDTDSSGIFTLDNLYFHDTAYFYVQTGVKMQGRTSNTVAINFYNSIFDSIARNNWVIAPLVLNSSTSPKVNVADSAVQARDGKLLQNIIVTARGKTHLDSVVAKYATGVFANPGAWVTTLDLTDNPHTQLSDQNVLEYLNGKVAGLNYAYYNGQPVIYWRFSNLIAGLSGVEQMKLNAPSFFLNERLLNTGPEGYDAMIQLLSGIRMADVVMVRVFKPGTLPNVPDNGPHGSVVIYLRNGTEAERPAQQAVFQQYSKIGYSKVHEFSNAGITAGRTTTLYWNPSVMADTATHTVIVRCMNYGNAKRFRIVAEGVDDKGHIIQLNRVIQ